MYRKTKFKTNKESFYEASNAIINIYIYKERVGDKEGWDVYILQTYRNKCLYFLPTIIENKQNKRHIIW